MARTALVLAALVFAPAGLLAEPGEHLEGPTENWLALMTRFSALPGLSATMREERHLRLLREPLVSWGSFHYAPPDQIARHITKPFRSWVVINGERARFGDEASREAIDLRSNPGLMAFVGAFRSILAGDADGLREAFDIRWSGGGGDARDHWHLSLAPKREPLRAFVRRIEVEGRDVLVERVSVEELGGDRTEMFFSDVDITGAVARDRASEIFGPAHP